MFYLVKGANSYLRPLLRRSDRTRCHMSRHMGKPTICPGENKGTDQLRGNREADQRLCFRYSDLNSKFQASSSFLLLSRPVCVGPVRKPHCWFSHEAAHIISLRLNARHLVKGLNRLLKSIYCPKNGVMCAVINEYRDQT